MSYIKRDIPVEMDPYNYYAIAILTEQGNVCPTEEEINLLERQLSTTYPNRTYFWQAAQSLTLRELIVDVVSLG